MDTAGHDGVDDVLLAFAADHRADEIEELVRAWKIEADNEIDPTEWMRRYEHTSLRASVQFNGMGLIELVTTDDEHRELLALIDANVERRWQRERTAGHPLEETVSSAEAPEAVGYDELADPHYCNGLEGTASSAEAPEAVAHPELEETVSSAEAPPTPPRVGWARRRAQAAAELLRIGFAHLDLPDDTTGADRYLLNINVTLADLTGHPCSQPTLAGGEPIDLRTALRAACDCAIVRHITGGASEPLDVGRKTRVWTTGQRRAVRHRDRNRCRFPGCHHHNTDLHHLRHWTAGGPTDTDNGCLLCPYHHRLVHEGHWTTTGTANTTITFTSPTGLALHTPTPTPTPRSPITAAPPATERTLCTATA